MAKEKNNQPDKDLAVKEHPRPSQAEGDRETVEEDLKQKEKQETPRRGSQEK